MNQETGSAVETLRSRMPRDRIRTITSRDFSQLALHALGRVAVEFMSYGCVHCRTIEPVLQQVADAVRSEITIYRVNIPVEEELAEEYDISGTPTFIMFLNGLVVGRVEGPVPTFDSLLRVVTDPFGIDGKALSKHAV